MTSGSQQLSEERIISSICQNRTVWFGKQKHRVLLAKLDPAVWKTRTSGFNEDITMSDTTTPSIEVHGPNMRSWAQPLNHQVNSFLCSSANDREDRLLPNDLIVIRNQGVDHGGHVGPQEGAGEPREHTQQGAEPIQFGVTESNFESNSESRATLPSN
jgi:hypothetical protein